MIRPHAQEASRAGYTVVELLVVVGVIAVLSSLLLPGLMMSRQAAKRAACTNNLRQIYAAIAMYDMDAGMLPIQAGEPATPALTSLIAQSDDGTRRRTGLGLLFPRYLRDGRVLYCPSSHTPTRQQIEASVRDCDAQAGRAAASLGQGGDLSDELNQSVRLSSYMYRGLADMPGFECAADPWLSVNDTNALVMDDNTGDLLRIEGVEASAPESFYKHKERGVNVLYADGGVKWRPDPNRRCRVPTDSLGKATRYARLWSWVDKRR